jgi:hypothetical protein
MRRAIRYKYFARTEPPHFDHFGKAFFAARTAAFTSAFPAHAMSANFSSVAGFIVANQDLDLGETNFPPINNLFFGSIDTFVFSGAGLYSQSAGVSCVESIAIVLFTPH